MYFSSLEVMDMNTFPSEKIKPHFKKLACWKKTLLFNIANHIGGVTLFPRLKIQSETFAIPNTPLQVWAHTCKAQPRFKRG
jgi:hypothetical protein